MGCSRGPETFYSNVRCHTNSYDHGSQKHTEETGRHISLATWPKSCRSKQAMSIWGPSLQHLSTRLDHLHTNKTEQQRKQSAVLRASASSPEPTVRVNTWVMMSQALLNPWPDKLRMNGPYKLHSIQNCLSSLWFPLWEEDGWPRSQHSSQRQTPKAPSPIQLPVPCSLTQTTHILALPHQEAQTSRSRDTMRKDVCLYSARSWRTCTKKNKLEG